MYPIMADLGSPLFSKQSLLVVMRRNYQQNKKNCIYRTNSQKLTELNDKCLITQITSFSTVACYLSLIRSINTYFISLGQLFLTEKKEYKRYGAKFAYTHCTEMLTFSLVTVVLTSFYYNLSHYIIALISHLLFGYGNSLI